MESTPRLVRITPPLITLAVSVVAGIIGIVLLAAVRRPVPITVLVPVAAILSVTIVSAVAYYAVERVIVAKNRSTQEILTAQHGEFAAVLRQLRLVEGEQNAIRLQVLRLYELVDPVASRLGHTLHRVEALERRAENADADTVQLPRVQRVPWRGAATAPAKAMTQGLNAEVLDLGRKIARRITDEG